MSIGSTLADAVALDDRSRQCLRETLADWRHESDSATTTLGRTAAAIRGVTALGLVTTLIVFRDLGRASIDRVMFLTIALLLTYCVGTWIYWQVHPPTTLDRLPPGLWATLEWRWLAIRALNILPLAPFLAICVAARRAGHAPVIGHAVGIFLIVLVAQIWGFAALGPVYPAFISGEFEGVVPHRYPLALFGTGSLSAYSNLVNGSELLSLATLAALLVLLGHSLNRHGWIARTLAAVIFVGLVFALGGSKGPTPSIISDLAQFWVLPAAAFVTLLAIILRGSRVAGISAPSTSGHP